MAEVEVTDDQGVEPELDPDQSTGEEDGILDPSDVWVYIADGTAIEGVYDNVGTATGNPVDENGGDIPGVEDRSADDPSSYVGIASGPGVIEIDIVKVTSDGISTDDLGNTTTVSAEDPSSYIGGTPDIAIEK